MQADGTSLPCDEDINSNSIDGAATNHREGNSEDTSTATPEDTANPTVSEDSATSTESRYSATPTVEVQPYIESATAHSNIKKCF